MAAFDKDKEQVVESGETRDEPAPVSKTIREPQGAFELITYLLKAVSKAQVGRDIFRSFAAEYQMQDRHKILFRVLLLPAFAVDYAFGLVAFALVTYVLLAVTLVVVRGLGVGPEANHVVSYVFHSVFG